MKPPQARRIIAGCTRHANVFIVISSYYATNNDIKKKKGQVEMLIRCWLLLLYVNWHNYEGDIMERECVEGA